MKLWGHVPSVQCLPPHPPLVPPPIITVSCIYMYVFATGWLYVKRDVYLLWTCHSFQTSGFVPGLPNFSDTCGVVELDIVVECGLLAITLPSCSSGFFSLMQPKIWSGDCWRQIQRSVTRLKMFSATLGLLYVTHMHVYSYIVHVYIYWLLFICVYCVASHNTGLPEGSRDPTGILSGVKRWGWSLDGCPGWPTAHS